MDSEKFSKKGRAHKHANLTVDEKTIHPDYEVELGDPEPSTTGRMVIFKLSPQSGSGPRFEGRWDDKQEELDVDVFGVSDKANREFKAGAHGYCGHHNGKAKFVSSGRTYDVKIEWPGIGTVFEGKATFEIHRVLRAETGCYLMTLNPATKTGKT